MNGIKVAAAIEDYDIPVIYLTAFTDDDILTAAIQTNPYGYLTKPPKLNDIKTALLLALNKHQQDTRLQEIILQEQKLQQLKSRFLAMAAHDLRTPLSIMAVCIDMLQEYDQNLSSAKKSKHFGRMRTAIKNMVQQIEKLLVLEPAESGKLPFESVPIDEIVFCENLVEDIQTMTDNKCKIYLSSEGESRPMNLDQDLLGHILYNLLSNAVKYSNVGGKISLSLSYSPESLTFRIQDQGIGIPPEFLDKMFEPFERAENVRRIKGTGIGLYIVKQAVDRHQGQLHVESKVGVGTTFTITLPSVSPVAYSKYLDTSYQLPVTSYQLPVKQLPVKLD